MTEPSVDSPRLMLAIESSCDETAAAIVDERLVVRSSVVASQIEQHRRFGGVVPEVASRAHVSSILPVIRDALTQSGVTLNDLHAVSVVTHPGLVGSLLVGLTAAKTLAATLGLPLVTVNHVEAHLYACRMYAGRPLPPAVGLVVSGGHTSLYDYRSPLDCTLIGTTIDDAAGEAFDKIAAILGLGFPGGPAIQAAAEKGSPTAYTFPRSFLHEADRLEFSFSGLKTAVLYEVAGKPPRDFDPNEIPRQRVADLAASFQAAVVDVLVAKCRQALRQLNRRVLCVGGGVAANAALRAALDKLARNEGIEVLIPPMNLCTDNAAMSALGWELLAAGRTADLNVDVAGGLLRKRSAK